MRRKVLLIPLIVMLVGITCSAVLYVDEHDKETAKLIKEFSRDHTRATALRNSKDINGLERLVKEIQNKWSQKDQQMYGALMAHALRAWKAAYTRSDREPPMNVIRQYATEVLSTYDPNKDDNISVETEFDLVNILHYQDIHARDKRYIIYTKDKRTDEEWASDRRKGAERFFHAWRRMERAIDPNWDPKENIPFMDVRPPKGAGYPGIPPERIKDPVLRAEYERAIKKNRQNIKYRREQRKLRQLKTSRYRTVEKYPISTYSIPPYDNAELHRLLDSGVKDNKIKAQFLKAIATKLPKETELKKSLYE